MRYRSITLFQVNLWKLDRVGPVDNRPSTDKLHHFVQKIKIKIVTCNMWHVTRDNWHVTCWVGWTFSQNFSSLALTVCDLWYYEDLEEKADSLAHKINDEAVYRTAPATPGLLKTQRMWILIEYFCASVGGIIVLLDFAFEGFLMSDFSLAMYTQLLGIWKYIYERTEIWQHEALKTRRGRPRWYQTLHR